MPPKLCPDQPFHAAIERAAYYRTFGIGILVQKDATDVSPAEDNFGNLDASSSERSVFQSTLLSQSGPWRDGVDHMFQTTLDCRSHGSANQH